MGLFQITKKPIQLKKEMEKGGGLKLTPFFFSSSFFFTNEESLGLLRKILQRIIKKSAPYETYGHLAHFLAPS